MNLQVTKGGWKHSKASLNTMVFTAPLRMESELGVKKCILMAKDLCDQVRQFLELSLPTNRFP